MKVKKFLKNLLFVVFFITLGTSLGLLGNKIFQNYKNANKTVQSNQNNLEGMGLLFMKNNKSIKNQYNLNVSQDTNFDYDLNLISKFKENKRITLTVLLDYNQIVFNIGNKKNIIKYNYFIKSNQSYKLPLRFSTKNLKEGIHHLIFNIDIYDSSSKNKLNSYNFITYCNLIVGNSNTNFIEQFQPETCKNIFLANGYLGAILNGQITKSKIKYNNTTIKAKPNQKIMIPLSIGGYDTNKYILCVFLNDELYPFDGNKKNFYFTIPNKSFAQKYITILAPKNHGEYTMYVAFITNPFEILTQNTTSKIDESVSNKIKIIVTN